MCSFVSGFFALNYVCKTMSMSLCVLSTIHSVSLSVWLLGKPGNSPVYLLAIVFFYCKLIELIDRYIFLKS